MPKKSHKRVGGYIYTCLQPRDVPDNVDCSGDCKWDVTRTCTPRSTTIQLNNVNQARAVFVFPIRHRMISINRSYKRFL